jgi:N-acetylmuramate 1-kinase
MLLQDARRDVSPEREAACLERYLAAEPSVPRADFLADYGAVAALHACRLIGLFTRPTVRDAKPRYAMYIPRMWNYLARDLTSPGMEPLAAWFDRYVLPEART